MIEMIDMALLSVNGTSFKKMMQNNNDSFRSNHVFQMNHRNNMLFQIFYNVT